MKLIEFSKIVIQDIDWNINCTKVEISNKLFKKQINLKLKYW
jgi:hypothetical protein